MQYMWAGLYPQAFAKACGAPPHLADRLPRAQERPREQIMPQQIDAWPQKGKPICFVRGAPSEKVSQAAKTQ